MRPPSRLGGAGTWGRKKTTPTSAMADRAAATRKVARQSKIAPTTLPIGMPMTKASVMPPETMARAEPRRSGGTREAAATLAAGPEMAPARPARARSISSVSKFDARLQARCSSRARLRPVITTSLRSSRPSAQAATGPSRAEVST